MKYSVDKEEKYTIFSLHEDNLNSLIAPSLKAEFTIFKNEGIPNLIFNMQDVRYVDSSGLSAILTGERLWKTDGSFIVTCIDHSNVKKLLEISKLIDVLTIIPTVQESIEYVFMEEVERELNSQD